MGDANFYYFTCLNFLTVSLSEKRNKTFYL